MFLTPITKTAGVPKCKTTVTNAFWRISPNA